MFPLLFSPILSFNVDMSFSHCEDHKEQELIHAAPDSALV